MSGPGSRWLRSDHTATAWEYRCGSFSPQSAEEEIQRLGDEGWELVGVVPEGSGIRLFLKRPGLDFRERVTLEQKRRYYLQFGLATPGVGDTKENA